MELNEYQQLEKERIEINNELVVPEIDAFIKRYDLRWNKVAAKSKMKLYVDVLSLFNRWKKNYYFFKGWVVSFQLKSWDTLDFSYQIYEVKDFIDQFQDQEQKLSILEKQKSIYMGLSQIGTAVLSLILIFWLRSRFGLIDKYPELFYIVGFGVLVFWIVFWPLFIDKLIIKNLNKKKEKEANRIKNDLKDLRQKIKTATK